jgi:glutamate synthase domain-containing protein 2
MTAGAGGTLGREGIATFWTAALGALTALALVIAAAAVALPWLVRHVVRALLSRPMSDTLAELYVSTRSTPPVDLLYASLRSQTGRLVIRPMGSARPAHGFDDLALVPAQLARRPRLASERVELATTLGRRARRPLALALPLYLSGMAYGLAVTRETRLALARASGEVGIPLNGGQGPFLPEERDLCSAYVLQFGRWAWNRSPDILRQADMIEIQVGQGAMPGNAIVASPGEVGPEIRRLMGLRPGEAPDIHADLYLERPDRPAALADVVGHLRGIVDGVPIAVKMGAGDRLEDDLDVALDAGVDVIVVDGTEGATGNAPITLSDHFGIPSLNALCRAVRHLERRGARGAVELCISGGFREPGDFLKAYALGADAVGLATVAMFALAHPQIARTVPFLPPTDLVFYRSRPRIPLDVERATAALVRFLRSCEEEMAVALRALGHLRVADLGPDDLCALDRDVARLARVRYAGDDRAGGGDGDGGADQRGRDGVLDALGPFGPALPARAARP